MKKPTDSYIETFRLQAERTDELGTSCAPDAAMFLLAQFMAQIEKSISEKEMISLTEIGTPIFHKELHR
ncbi:hypothetical protein [Comamonas sp.]|uniref:hypothetical protein n=1 Tax=Comamonas sp. TaxID=34028 RepID=UPI0028AB861D|nr:hypothetical protein [Comamonas sp.]